MALRWELSGCGGEDRVVPAPTQQGEQPGEAPGAELPRPGAAPGQELAFHYEKKGADSETPGV